MVDARRRTLGDQWAFDGVRIQGGARIGAGTGPVVSRLAAAGQADPPPRLPSTDVYPADVTAAGRVSNGGTITVPTLDPGWVWGIHINATWNGTETEFDYGTEPGFGGVMILVPPHFYGEVTLGNHVRDKRIVSRSASGSSVGSYTVAGYWDGGHALKAQAFPPAGYPTTITCALGFTARALRPT